MAYAANLDFSNRMVSRLSLSHQQQQPPQHQHQHQPQPHHIIDDDDELDDSGEQAMISPSSIDEGRESYANSSATIFSPQSSTWGDFHAPPLDRTQSMSNGPFFESAVSDNFQRPQLAGSFGQQPSWPMVDRSADPRVPFGGPQAHDAFAPGEFHAGPRSYMPVASSAPAYTIAPMANNVRPSSVFPPAPGSDTPLSASPEKWNPINGDADQQPLSKRPRQHSPSRPFSPGPFTRRDGIRKKNARFEIPAERNLHTIDQLISEATNEDEIKELKQQKRLLRNRQAALDSRQRKKKHTEDLEEEKKQWNERYSMLETDLENMRIEREQYAADRVHWDQQFFQQQQQIHALQMEKENLVSTHTLETGELRKKVNYLTDKLDKASSAATTVTPASTDFTDFGLEMNGLGLEGDEFNNYIFVDPQFGGEHDNAQLHARQPQAARNSSTAIATRPKQQQPQQQPAPGSDGEKPVASGILFMLLLCGAFVASKATGTRAPPMPRMPADVRAASATVLDNLLKDAGSGNGDTAHQAVASGIQQALEPGPSAGAPGSWHTQPQHKAVLSGAEFASLSRASGLGINGMPPSALDQLHHGLVAPTAEQEGEQLFTMTPAQYNSLANPDYHHRQQYGGSFTQPTPPMSDDDPGPISGRKSLAASLQRMRQDSVAEGAAEVYTRSLLWDRVPSDVVREFKRMVEESNKLTEAEQDVKNEA